MEGQEQRTVSEAQGGRVRGSWLVFIRENGGHLAVEEEILKEAQSLGQFPRPGV